jgi:hypothetical protein
VSHLHLCGGCGGGEEAASPGGAGLLAVSGYDSALRIYACADAAADAATAAAGGGGAPPLRVLQVRGGLLRAGMRARARVLSCPRFACPSPRLRPPALLLRVCADTWKTPPL